MNLAIVGTGLVSPIGLTPLQHACFPRAGIGLHPASAFVGGDGEPVPVLHCPWLGAKLPIAERLAALGAHALRNATKAIEPLPQFARECALLLCLGATRPGLTEADRQRAAGAIEDATTASLGRVFTGAASFFAALVEAEHLLDAGEAGAVVIAAADSFISIEAVRAELEAAPLTWTREAPPPSEAAAALVLVKAADARELRLSLGTIHYSGVLKGQGNDDDDEIVDGAALAALLEQAYRLDEPLVRAYGQDQVDRLRQVDWTCAAARNAERFHPLFTIECLERWTGRIGAAAGAAQLVYGLAAERHHAVHEAQAGAGPMVAWAISRDGMRGLCVARAGGA